MAVTATEEKEATKAVIAAHVGNDMKLKKSVEDKVAAWKAAGGLTKAIATGIEAVVKAVRWFVRNLIRGILFLYIWGVCPFMALLFWLFTAGVNTIAAVQRKLANKKAVKAAKK